MTQQTPIDQPVRDEIATNLDTNLFVEAGAGAGKTSSLVARILATVASGVDLDQIAAITFTEKAAAELRHRLRMRLSEAVAADLDPLVSVRYSRAIDQLDHAAIGTLHAFARRLLTEFPIPAQLPPGFAVMDELESNIRFDDRWEQFLDRLLSSDQPESALEGGSRLYALCDFDGFGLINKIATLPSGFERIGRDFQANWDLVAERVDTTDPGWWTPDLHPVIVACTDVGFTTCPPEDRQAEKCAEIARLGTELETAGTLSAQLAALDQIAKVLKNPDRVGNKTAWTKHGLDLDAVRAAERELRDLAKRVLDEARAYRKRLIGAIIGSWVLDCAAERRTDGTIEFHDLLVLARQLVTQHPTVRAALHDRYQRILLDEFQDTDPLQLEIAVRLTARPDDPQQDPYPAGDWRRLTPLPGRLFIVGDPKQSIYRFRRADIAQYLAAADQLGAEELTLSVNFRSTPQVIDWVNDVFSHLIIEKNDVQPKYRPLRAFRSAPGTVRLLGADTPVNAPEGERVDAQQLRSVEADLVVAAVTSALADGWEVGDGDERRPCTPGDICVLLPARTSLPQLEQAFAAAGVPYRAENSAVVYTTIEIRNLMLVLRAIDDPTDELALVAALRTPMFGVSDVELYEWRNAGGRWSIWTSPPEGLEEHRVTGALARLAPLARAAWEHTPAELLSTIVDDRRILDAALDQSDARDVWRRVRFVIEQARAWSDSGGHGLRRYLGWVQRQASEARTGDTVLPEHDHDAVRVMTVHAAKGLEFPITIVSGLTTRFSKNSRYGVAWPETGWAITKRNQDPEFDEYEPVDEQMGDAERRRLLYVACTRAVDHLVVSMVHEGRHTDADGQPPPPKTSAELLLDADPRRFGEPFVASEATWRPGRPVAPALAHADVGSWRVERLAAIDGASRMRSVSATSVAAGAIADAEIAALDPGLDKEPVDLDLPAWQRGRYGTAVGRAVHAVLQYCDLASGDDIDAYAAAQCAAEGILGMDDLVAELARSAIQAPIVRTAIGSSHHRELFVAAPIGDRTLEGYIDLFVETPSGGIIVDYKTDQWSDPTEGGERIARYRLQLAAYGQALATVLGRPAEGAVLVRCRVGQPAEQIWIDDWDAALGEIATITASIGGTRSS